MKTVLIQGAMEEEVARLIVYFKPQKSEIIGGYEFFIARRQDAKIIISRTKIGILNATMATTIAVLKYKPDVVVNQGIAGSALVQLNIGDIIIGESAIYINDFRPPQKGKGEGSDSLEWIPNPKRSYLVYAEKNLVKIAKEVPVDSKKIVGRLGSGDMFTREYDRICFLQKNFGHMCEDMESVASYKVCENFFIPCIGFRMISNNELDSRPIDRTMCDRIQKFAIDFVEKIIKE